MKVNRDPEEKFLLKIQKAGWTVVAHVKYNTLTEKVRFHIAQWMHDAMGSVFNVYTSVDEYRDLLVKVDPVISFYQRTAFNARTEQNEMLKEFKIHDTADCLLMQALGNSLEELYVKMKLQKPITNKKK